MALADYSEVFTIAKKKMYVTICVYQCTDYGTKSELNHMLSDIVLDLKKELSDYESIDVTYVYEMQDKVGIKASGILTKDTLPLFVEGNKYIDNHNLNHLFYMGMAQLKKSKEKKENAELRQYLVSDEKFIVSDNVLWETNGKKSLNPAFKDLNEKIYFYKSKNAGDEILEEYLRNSNNCKVVIYD